MIRFSTLASASLVLALGLGLGACKGHDGDHAHDHADGEDHDHDGDGHADHDHAGHDHAHGDDHDHDGDGKPDHAPGDHTEATYVEASADYALKTCVVSGDDLGEVGDRVAIEHEGRQVQFCCELCVEQFQKSPAKFLAKLNGK